MDAIAGWALLSGTDFCPPGLGTCIRPLCHRENVKPVAEAPLQGWHNGTNAHRARESAQLR